MGTSFTSYRRRSPPSAQSVEVKVVKAVAAQLGVPSEFILGSRHAWKSLMGCSRQEIECGRVP